MSTTTDLLSRPNGASTLELAAALGLTDSGAHYRIRKMMRDGLAHEIRDGAWARRYFATAEARDVWAATVRVKPVREYALEILAANGTKPTRARDLQKVCGVNRAVATSCFDRIAEVGKAFRLTYRKRAAFFQCQADALAWRDAQIEAELKRAVKVRKQKKVAAQKAANKPIKTKPGIPAAVVIKVAPVAREVDWSKAVWTRDTTPRPTARFQVLTLPADPRWPSFSGRVGQYDEVTA